MKTANLIFLCFFVCLGMVFHDTAWSKVTFDGVLDTSVYLYPTTENTDLTETDTSYRVQESLLFDLGFTDKFSFHFNSRFMYWTEKYENPEPLALNFYYGFFQYELTHKLVLQAGRILDSGNMALTYYDGASLEYGATLFKQDFTFNLFGGMVVNDDYLDEDSLAGFNSFDFRNFFIKQRAGDYTTGVKAKCHIKKAAMVGAEYQVLFNNGAIAEHYVSLDVETLFSKMVRFYGNGVFDIVEGLFANTLAGAEINPIKKLSIFLEHEYYRPVFLRDSYFWNYFISYGSHEISCMPVYSLTNLLRVHAKYGAILYESESTPGHEISAGIEHINFYNTRIKLNGEYLFGPEGKKITLMTVANRQFFVINTMAGCGVVFYQNGEGSDAFDNGIFAMLGGEAPIIKDLLSSLTMEYYHNPKYNNDLRGIFSLKYLF